MHPINSSNDINVINKNNIAQQNHQHNNQMQMKSFTNENIHSTINSKTTTSDLINDINNHLNITNLSEQKIIDKGNTTFQTNNNTKPINETSRNMVLNNFAKINAANNNNNNDHHNLLSQKINNNNNHLYQNNQNNQSNGSLNAMDIASPSSSVISNEHNLHGYLNQNHVLLQNGTINGYTSSNSSNINSNYTNKQNNYFIKSNTNLNGNYTNSELFKFVSIFFKNLLFHMRIFSSYIALIKSLLN